MDLMLITSTEDIDDNQVFFEKQNIKYETGNRILNEYELSEWDIFSRTEGDLYERENISDRQNAIRRISNILQEVPPNK